jgi:hypothetical protein
MFYSAAGAERFTTPRKRRMKKLIYKIIKHDGGWAYRADETVSGPFASHDAAFRAAELAAKEQSAPGESTIISYEDRQGHWHEEQSLPNDRPKTIVRV